MKNYLPHLFADLRQAHRPEPDEEEDSDRSLTLEQELEEMERWVFTEPEVTFGQYCGLAREQFPPAERWTEADLREIITEFRHMMFSWGVTTDLPDDLPPALSYGFLVRTLDEKIHLMPEGGFTSIGFCGNKPLECEFGQEYCSCRKYDEAADRNRAVSPLHDEVIELVMDIRAAVARMPESLEFQDAVGELQSELGDGGPVYRPLAKWLDIDLERFLPVEALSDWEASRLADEMLSLFDWDDELAMAVKMVGDPARRYELALQFFSQQVHHEGYGRYRYRPLTEGERNVLPKDIPSPLDSLNLDLQGMEHPEEEEDDELPF